MDTEKELKQLWDNIDYYNGGSLQLNIHHSLEWHVSYVIKLKKAIVIVSNCVPNEIESSKSIEASIIKRTDGRYNTTLALLENNQEDVFISMCANLIEYSADAVTEEEAMKKTVYRYKQWRRLMEHTHVSLLTLEEQKGLIGELLYLKEMIDNGISNKEAVNGWVGPIGADQDFAYNKQWHEIKSTGVASKEITINSVEQLGNAGARGELIVQHIDKCAPEYEKAFSLNDIVNQLEALLKDDGEVLDQFVSLLNNVGYISLPDYDRYKFKYSGKEKYTINEGFPRITRDTLRKEIVNCCYKLDLPCIESWRKDGED